MPLRNANLIHWENKPRPRRKCRQKTLAFIPHAAQSMADAAFLKLGVCGEREVAWPLTHL